MSGLSREARNGVGDVRVTDVTTSLPFDPYVSGNLLISPVLELLDVLSVIMSVVEKKPPLQCFLDLLVCGRWR